MPLKRFLQTLLPQGSAVLMLLFCAATVQAATCYGRAENTLASIYCTGEGDEDENCTFLWQLNDLNGSDEPWRGGFRVRHSEMNALKMRSGTIASPAGSLNYKCSPVLQTIGADRIGDVAQDQADHNVLRFEHFEQQSSIKVAKVTKARTRQPCGRPVANPRSALAANHIAGYDEHDPATCGSQ